MYGHDGQQQREIVRGMYCHLKHLRTKMQTFLELTRSVQNCCKKKEQYMRGLTCCLYVNYAYKNRTMPFLINLNCATPDLFRIII